MITDILAGLGAKPDSPQHYLAIYVPSHDAFGQPIPLQGNWVDRVSHALCLIAGGVTVMPACNGGWLNSDNGVVVWEQPIQVWAYVTPSRLYAALPELRALLHELGRETRQGAVGFELDGQFYTITEYDAKEVAA
jgi:hypothetical protein